MNDFTLPRLPFKFNALEPFMSHKSVEIHHANLHANYVSHLNADIVDTEFQHQPLEKIITTLYDTVYVNGVKGLHKDASPVLKTYRKILNNASQHFNHSMFWQCLTPSHINVPDNLRQQLVNNFGGTQDFISKFTEHAVSHFGSGWVWLCQYNDRQDRLAIIETNNAGCPIVDGMIPLLVLDVWEHAYFLDSWDRKKYVDNFWHIVNWEYVNSQLK